MISADSPCVYPNEEIIFIIMKKRSCHSPLKGIIVEVDHSKAIQKGGILGVKTER